MPHQRTEDPEQNFILPDYGGITAYRGATGFGIRLDGGTAYSGAVITGFYDPLLEKDHRLGAQSGRRHPRGWIAPCVNSASVAWQPI